MIVILIILLCAALILLFCAAPGRIPPERREELRGRYFAHRGLHERDLSVPENSMEAFRRAVEAGYGVELDVHLSSDNQVVVFHDDTLDRVCGVSGGVEDFSSAELREQTLCGTSERIPLLSEVLTLVGGRVPILLEFKTGRRNRELCEKTLALLRGYRGEVILQSFDPTIMRWCRRCAGEYTRGQLATDRQDYIDSGKSGFVAWLLSNTLLDFLSRPQFISYRVGPRPILVRLAESLGALRFGWVSREPSEEAGLDVVIFEFYRP